MPAPAQAPTQWLGFSFVGQAFDVAESQEARCKPSNTERERERERQTHVERDRAAHGLAMCYGLLRIRLGLASVEVTEYGTAAALTLRIRHRHVAFWPSKGHVASPGRRSSKLLPVALGACFHRSVRSNFAWAVSHLAAKKCKL